jgi:hypothetical protein
VSNDNYSIKGDIQMNASRKTALVVGVLFILTFVTSIAGELAYGPVLSNPHYITGAGSDPRVFLGAFFELFLIITKHQNEALALGYVTARLVECTFILIGILSVLAVVTLRQGASGTDANTLVTVGTSLIAIKNWSFLLGPGFMDGIGTGLMLGWLMYRSDLVPRRVALFGVIGGPLLAASGIAVLFGVFKAGSPMQGIATIPEVIWEGYLAIWLTFKGFKHVSLASGATTEIRAAVSTPSEPVVAA